MDGSRKNYAGRKALYIVIILSLIVLAFVYNFFPKSEQNVVKVGYPPVSTSLPLFVAIDQKIFSNKGLSIEPIRFETANQITEALVANRIDATSVSADFPFLTMAQRAPDAFKLYAWEMLDTNIPFDMILVRKDSSINSIADLHNKTVATFPGSQLRYYFQLILKKATEGTVDVTVTEMIPSNQIPALVSKSVDAIFCLEPICTIALEKGIGKILVTSPISRYISDGSPMPAASFAISSRFIQHRPKTALSFVEAMWSAIDLINANQERWRYLYPTFTPITPELAPKIPVTIFSKVNDMDLSLFQKEADILYEAGLLNRRTDVETLVYRK
uniref:NitT/TauT family transport system substrate-binding protein n=1 Tax=Candidatus Kentrum sp. UNK TaxID=2126344 RepID=A0A451AT52_9GAMM|nr:MAG: NitT/TauT family transport system substrate-binding protein [Candidatus Kentron sp. UNK]VFK69231.1 MAG: NitT/TauT family transport system substrate-binding protein [Candidatus Kentron sp. UNK]